MEAKGTLFIVSILWCSINANGGGAAKSSHITSTGKFTLQDLSGKVTTASVLGDTMKGQMQIIGNHYTLYCMCPDGRFPFLCKVSFVLMLCSP